MKANYLTIEREYGSGGTKIARQLAEATGLACYGEEILDEVSHRLHIGVDEIQNYEETTTNSFLYSLYVVAKASSGQTDMLNTQGRIFAEEQNVIRNMAEKGRAIFVGHCACRALDNREGVINVFIRCSDYEMKRAMIRDEYGIAEKDIEDTRKRYDRKRSNYFNAYTGEKWDSSSNYDIVLDSANLGLEGCVQLLTGILV